MTGSRNDSTAGSRNQRASWQTTKNQMNRAAGQIRYWLSGELAWDGSDHRRPVVLCRGEPVASFEYRAPGERRVLTRLEFLGGRRSIDVTVQPDTPRVAACDGVVALPVRPLHVPGPVQAVAVGSDDEFRGIRMPCCGSTAPTPGVTFDVSPVSDNVL